MKKKILIQVTLFISLIIISILTFNFYYKKNLTKKIGIKETLNSSENTTLSDQQNLILDIKYSANNTTGDIFEILADYGETNSENPELMFLTNVKAKIIFKNERKENVYLNSNFANFNTRTFETTFVEDVKITRKDETIVGDELYMVLDRDEEILKNEPNKEKNILRMSNNVSFQKPGYKLKADVLEIDLVTKNLKIYMNNLNNKVMINAELK